MRKGLVSLLIVLISSAGLKSQSDTMPCSDVWRKYEDSFEENVKLKIALVNVKDSLTTAKRDMNLLADALIGYKNVIDSLESMKGIVSEFDVLSQRYDSIQKLLSTLEQDVYRLQGDSMSMKTSLVDLNKKIRELDEEISFLKQDNEKCISELKLVRTRLKRYSVLAVADIRRIYVGVKEWTMGGDLDSQDPDWIGLQKELDMYKKDFPDNESLVLAASRASEFNDYVRIIDRADSVLSVAYEREKVKYMIHGLKTMESKNQTIDSKARDLSRLLINYCKHHNEVLAYIKKSEDFSSNAFRLRTLDNGMVWAEGYPFLVQSVEGKKSHPDRKCRLQEIGRCSP